MGDTAQGAPGQMASVIDSQDGTGYNNWEGVGEGGGSVAEGRTDPGGVAAVQSGLYTEAK